MYNYQLSNLKEKKLSDMTVVERGKTMAPLLYDLLTTQSHVSFGEDNIIKIISDYLPHNKFYTDEKGNLSTVVLDGNKECRFIFS